MFPRTRQPRMERMDKVIRMYTKFDDIKADEYRYWRRRPVHERTDAVEKMNPDGNRPQGDGRSSPGQVRETGRQLKLRML